METINLQDFLIEASETELVDTVIVSKRYMAVPFKIKSASMGDYDRFVAQARRGTGGNDNTKMLVAMILDQCIEPNFRDSNWIAKLGCTTPEQAVNKILNAGEVVRLTEAIAKLSGFDKDLTWLVDEAKNS